MGSRAEPWRRSSGGCGAAGYFLTIPASLRSLTAIPTSQINELREAVVMMIKTKRADLRRKQREDALASGMVPAAAAAETKQAAVSSGRSASPAATKKSASKKRN